MNNFGVFSDRLNLGWALETVPTEWEHLERT